MCTVAMAHTINWHVDGDIYQTTTCDSGESITPPTAPYKYGYHLKEWRNLYIGTIKTTSAGNDAAIKVNINGTENNIYHRDVYNLPIYIGDFLRVVYSGKWEITNISSYAIIIGSQTVFPGAGINWKYNTTVNYTIYYDLSNWSL